MTTTASRQSETNIFAAQTERASLHSSRVHACIVLPTYNEAPNIKRMLDQITFQYTRHQRVHQKQHTTSVKLSVLVVDDNSPDGTAAIVSAFSNAYHNVHLLIREQKNGLGAAYMHGMDFATETLQPDIIIEMDADGQHNPADIFRLIQGIEDGGDFVIGSRYVAGGSTPASWKPHRRLISRSANAYTKLLLRTGGAQDCTGGFRAIRSSVLANIDFSRLQTKGYAFQVTLLDAAVRNGANIVEIPIKFQERVRGESKMRASEIINGAITLALMRLKQGWNRTSANNVEATSSHTQESSSRRLGERTISEEQTP